ncbi:hypothetical protein DPMN_191514 [Dreissena polymorpha]|uniref:Uncharacterized protein n=1 Tax=Dreissena polymorpha TaxID=45954 RepID=A0A9D4BBT7_DREPO|nr:hypothetical protein DPMN_191514 [Dreissena polymorpha]
MKGFTVDPLSIGLQSNKPGSGYNVFLRFHQVTYFLETLTQAYSTKMSMSIRFHHIESKKAWFLPSPDDPLTQQVNPRMSEICSGSYSGRQKHDL